MTGFYARELAVCGGCGVAWEPIPEDQVWDRSDPHCSLREPCSNCAFRPGSPEQANPEEWKKLIASLRGGASFYCHKGVPLEPGGEEGFAYPKDAAGKPIIAKQRLCRGYLNALGKWWGAAEPDQSKQPSVPGQPGERA